ncbi:MAG: BtpA/SgcQ family protein [Candidatus Cloacimonadales bacterium]
MKFYDLIKQQKMVIGMVHTLASPGAPKNNCSVPEIVQRAVQEAKIYAEAGLDAIIIENMHDVPYQRRAVGPEVVSTLTAVALAIKAAVRLPVGLQILAGANRQAMAVALAADLDFIRAEGFVFSHVADEGLMDSDAAELLRYRRMIGAEAVKIFCDIKKKHSSHALTNDLKISEFAAAADFFLADGLIVTGSSTAAAAKLADVQDVKNASKNPVLIGSGLTDQNIQEYWNEADGFIIGSYFKTAGYWENAIDPQRLQNLMLQVSQLRRQNK